MHGTAEILDAHEFVGQLVEEVTLCSCVPHLKNTKGKFLYPLDWNEVFNYAIFFILCTSSQANAQLKMLSGV